MIPVGNKGLVIEKVDGPSHLKVVEEFGYEMYMHCGAIRKVLLAWQTPTFIDEYFRTIIIHDQAFPHVRPDDLREELKKIRQDGYAITRGDMSTMLSGSVPRSSTLRASLQVSIGIIAPEIRIGSPELLETQRDLVQFYASALSSDLGYEKHDVFQ